MLVKRSRGPCIYLGIQSDPSPTPIQVIHVLVSDRLGFFSSGNICSYAYCACRLWFATWCCMHLIFEHFINEFEWHFHCIWRLYKHNKMCQYSRIKRRLDIKLYCHWIKACWCPICNSKRTSMGGNIMRKWMTAKTISHTNHFMQNKYCQRPVRDNQCLNRAGHHKYPWY